jgi:hypothetical protein
VDVGSGFICGVYGFTVDKDFPDQALSAANSGLIKGSVIAAGLAFIKAVKSTQLSNMRFPNLAQLSVPGTTVKSQRYALTNAARQQASFSPHASIPYTYTQNWASPSRVQAAFATLVRARRLYLLACMGVQTCTYVWLDSPRLIQSNGSSSAGR